MELHHACFLNFVRKPLCEDRTHACVSLPSRRAPAFNSLASATEKLARVVCNIGVVAMGVPYVFFSARRRRLAGRTSMLAASEEQSNDLREACRKRKQLFGQIRKLDKLVQSRTPVAVSQEDEEFIRELAIAAREWILSPQWTRTASGFEADSQPGLMQRIYLFRGKGVDVRLHLFQDPAESLVHNHGAAFWTACLAGEYLNKIITADGGDAGHYSFRREPDASLSPPVRKDGALQVGLQHSHCPGQAFFLHGSAYHTVTPGGGTSSSPAPVLTLYVKGTEKTHVTHMLHQREEPDWGCLGDEEIKLDDAEREDLFHQVHGLLRSSEAN